jgi:hypothetical protein
MHSIKQEGKMYTPIGQGPIQPIFGQKPIKEITDDMYKYFRTMERMIAKNLDYKHRIKFERKIKSKLIVQDLNNILQIMKDVVNRHIADKECFHFGWEEAEADVEKLKDKIRELESTVNEKDSSMKKLEKRVRKLEKKSKK